MGLLGRYKHGPNPRLQSPVGCSGSQNTAGRQAIWGRRIGLFASVFVPLTAILQGSVLKKRTFFWRFCGVRNASERRTFCCAVHQKRDFKAHPTASTALLVGSFQLAADSRLSTHSSSTLDLDSLSTLETCDPATARVDSEASSSTVALRKAFSMVATIPCRFIVCDPHASSFLILRFGTGDPHRSPSPTRAPSPGHPPAVVPTSESDWLND